MEVVISTSLKEEQEEWMLIGKLLADQCNNNQLKKEYLMFAQLICSRHNFNKSFIDLVKAKLLYHQNPILRKQDQSIISSYVNNQITFVDLIKSGRIPKENITAEPNNSDKVALKYVLLKPKFAK